MRLSLYIAIALFFSSTLFGQTATLRGVVTDQSGAIVPGATVAVTNNTGAANTTASASDGSYSIAVLPGDHTVQASAPDLALPQPAKIAHLMRWGSHGPGTNTTAATPSTTATSSTRATHSVVA